MSVYIKSLFIAIPIFSVLILIEMIFSKIKGIKVNHSADMISSLSSGISNITKDAVIFGFAIVSYSWFVENLTIYKLEPIWIAVLFAFLVQDFAGYWTHRFTHRVNILWNRHIIHHSSEEFNLSCALRQSISHTFKFFTFLWLPAAFMGIPAQIFAIIAPLQLFMQFWYHTRLIDKMGILEYILVTPSHHRVHHAINPEYLDKNYSQIFIIWDKLFGTFQEELKDVKPVYGIIRPSSTWNPIIINFKHLFLLIRDAWYTRKITDKFKIWFMPTGWRPEDVVKRFPIKQIDNPNLQIKYKTNNSFVLLSWTWFQYFVAFFLMFHLFIVLSEYQMIMNYLYVSFLLLHIFSFTSTLDYKYYAVVADFLKLIMGIAIIYFQNFSWFGLNNFFVLLLLVYLLVSLIVSFYFYEKNKKIKLAL